jgi:hypothetical protein
VLHAFDSSNPFGEQTLDKIAQLKEVYDLDLTAADAHRLLERGSKIRPCGANPLRPARGP